ncbi:hypothetical protein QPM17_18555 [Marinobacter sp. TBZ242]|uniref:Uncharacterized protein n=1 Tax=Marinobacter azerbaijanicus TaxID=3050455 RepID=A0ABT7IG73_9GAMM|nr:hypothetical protein [Marinobacter sp. TBZ242]MDL0433146.1 hypothetical protein [Marinobacter sp. TBZ242]
MSDEEAWGENFGPFLFGADVIVLLLYDGQKYDSVVNAGDATGNLFQTVARVCFG